MRVGNLLAAVVLSAISASGLAFASVAQAQARWTLIPLYFDPATGAADVPLAINDAGWMTGNIFYDPYGDAQGFLRDPNGIYSSFVVGQDTEPRGIDNNNRVVGASYVGPGYDFNEFSRAADGTVTWLRNPGTGLLLDGFAQGQDSNGDIVGDYLTGPDGMSGPVHGFILNGSSFTDLSFPGSTETKARGVNDAGVVVGYEATGPVISGFIDDHGTWITYDHPGADGGTVFEDINDKGLVVGQWTHFTPDGPIFHSFLYDPATNTTRELDPPDHSLFVQAFSVNNLDQVVVIGLNDWIFNADVVPEPGAWATMLLGLGAVGAAMRRRVGCSSAGKA
jgi:hypothetical protein